MATQQPDHDPQETQEWLDALQSVLDKEGAPRAHFLMDQLIHHARMAGDDMPISATTPYLNTIPLDKEERSAGNFELEHPDALERDGHRDERQQGVVRVGRPHRQLRFGRDLV
jgi:pyruvate dehydrogenase complex dehydrogenase (E1) component